MIFKKEEREVRIWEVLKFLKNHFPQLKRLWKEGCLKFFGEEKREIIVRERKRENIEGFLDFRNEKRFGGENVERIPIFRIFWQFSHKDTPGYCCVVLASEKNTGRTSLPTIFSSARQHERRADFNFIRIVRKFWQQIVRQFRIFRILKQFEIFRQFIQFWIIWQFTQFKLFCYFPKIINWVTKRHC